MPLPLRYSCNIINKVVHFIVELTNRRTIANAAVAGLDSRLRTLGLTSDNSFNIIRDFLMEVFQAAGCSIFAVDELQSKLQCVATSGLVINGEELPVELASYDLPLHDASGDTPHRTVNVVLDSCRLRLTTGKCVYRVNHRKEWVRDEQPAERKLESIGLTDLEHRRSMFFVVWLPSAKVPLGVVRIIRSARERPFTEFDEVTLAALNTVIAEAFVRGNARKLGTPRFDDPQLLELHTQYAMSWTSQDDSGRYLGYDSAVRRLLETPTQFQGWTRRRIEAVLQDVFFAFDTKFPVLAMFRVVVPDGHRGGSLRVMAIHAHSFLELPEGAIKGIPEADGGIGWDCVKKHRSIQFNRFDHNGIEDRGFTPTFGECQEHTRQGICIPVLIPFRDAPTMGVLSIEVNSNNSIGAAEWALAAAAAFQISNAAVDQDTPSFFLSVLGSEMQSKAEASADPASALLSEFLENSNEKEDWTFGVQIFAINGMLSAGQISPTDLGVFGDATDLLEILSIVATRKVPPEAYPSDGDIPPVAFSRVPTEVEVDLHKLRTLGCQVDLDLGRFRMPLWLGAAQCGFFFGRFEVGMKDFQPESAFQSICRFVKDANRIWTFVARKSTVMIGREPHWGVIREKVRGRLPSTRAEWRFLGQFGGHWITDSAAAEPAG